MPINAHSAREADAIGQHIKVMLTTPQGTRVMRRDLGVPFVTPDGRPVSGWSSSQIASAATDAIFARFPEQHFGHWRQLISAPDVCLDPATGFLSKISVSYQAPGTGETLVVTINYPLEFTS
jgi:uncharacterized protein